MFTAYFIKSLNKALSYTLISHTKKFGKSFNNPTDRGSTLDSIQIDQVICGVISVYIYIHKNHWKRFQELLTWNMLKTKLNWLKLLQQLKMWSFVTRPHIHAKMFWLPSVFTAMNSKKQFGLVSGAIMIVIMCFWLLRLTSATQKCKVLNLYLCTDREEQRETVGGRKRDWQRELSTDRWTCNARQWHTWDIFHYPYNSYQSMTQTYRHGYLFVHF